MIWRLLEVGESWRGRVEVSMCGLCGVRVVEG